MNELPFTEEAVKSYVEEYFSRFPLIRPPKHVLVINDVIKHDRLLFSGLQPSWLRDTIIVSWPLMRYDTLLHETLHTYGCGEECAWAVAPRLAALRLRLPPLYRRGIAYEVCPGHSGCRYYELHRMLGSKLIHLVRKTV